MTTPDELTAGLPAPRDDEPAQLRRDIADELADHLRCAVRRERLKEGHGAQSDKAALRAAIKHFGEPTEVACRLWWDAMKEKIMAQRAFAGMAAVTAIASIVCCVLLWQMVRDSRAEQASLFTAQREALAALVAEVKAPRDATPIAGKDAWQTLRIKLVDSAGKPIAGDVNCSGTPLESPEGKKISDDARTSPDGTAQFSLPPGKYSIYVNTSLEWTWLTALVGPGRSSERTIICPTEADEKRVPLGFEIKPENETLAKMPMLFLVELARQERTFEGLDWRPRGSMKTQFLLDREGHMLRQLPPFDDQGQAKLSLVTAEWLQNQVALATPFIQAQIQEQFSNLGAQQTPMLVYGNASFPAHIPADDVARSKPLGVIPANYTISLAPYVPKDEAAAKEAGDGEIPALRPLWDEGCVAQSDLKVPTAGLASYRIGRKLIDWTELARTYQSKKMPNPAGQASAPAYPAAPSGYYAPPAANAQPYGAVSPYGEAVRPAAQIVPAPDSSAAPYGGSITTAPASVPHYTTPPPSAAPAAPQIPANVPTIVPTPTVVPPSNEAPPPSKVPNTVPPSKGKR